MARASRDRRADHVEGAAPTGELRALARPCPVATWTARGKPGGGRGLDVAQLVADEERAARGRDRGAAAAARIMPGAGFRQPQPCPFRAMGAGELGVEDDALLREQIAEARGDRLVVVPAVEAAADAGLVGDEHERVAGVAKPTERSGTPAMQPDVVRVGDVAGVLDQRAVAVEKERGAVAPRLLGEAEAVDAVVHARLSAPRRPRRWPRREDGRGRCAPPGCARSVVAARSGNGRRALRRDLRRRRAR